MQPTLDIFPLVKFSGVLVRLSNLWWVVGRGGGGWLGARNVAPTRNIAPCEHWGRVCRSLITPATCELWATMNEVREGQSAMASRGAPQGCVHTLFASHPRNLPIAIAERVLAEETLTMRPTREGLFSTNIADPDFSGGPWAGVRYLHPFEGADGIAARRRSGPWTAYFMTMRESTAILATGGWGD